MPVGRLTHVTGSSPSMLKPAEATGPKPLPSVARTWRVCAPSSRPGDAQVPCAPDPHVDQPVPSRLHWKLVAPAGAALGAGAQALVELRDAAQREGPVLAEARYAWTGAGGAVPFVVVVPAERLATVSLLRLRAAVASGGRVQWLSEARELPARAGSV